MATQKRDRIMIITTLTVVAVVVLIFRQPLGEMARDMPYYWSQP